MSRVSLAKVKAKLSTYVNDAEFSGKTTVITRHGKPAAVVGPAPKREPVVLPRDRLQTLMAEDAKTADLAGSAVEDLLASRR